MAKNRADITKNNIMLMIFIIVTLINSSCAQSKIQLFSFHEEWIGTWSIDSQSSEFTLSITEDANISGEGNPIVFMVSDGDTIPWQKSEIEHIEEDIPWLVTQNFRFEGKVRRNGRIVGKGRWQKAQKGNVLTSLGTGWEKAIAHMDSWCDGYVKGQVDLELGIGSGTWYAEDGMDFQISWSVKRVGSPN